MRPTDCAACEQRKGTELMADGRLFCAGCARTVPHLAPEDERSWLEAWGDFVAWMEREETAADA